MCLRELAYSRAGDKGDISNVVLVPFDESDHDWLGRHVTAERVAEHFSGLVHGEVQRYEMPGIKAWNFVMTKALGGGVSRSLALDTHGKARASHMLAMVVETEEQPPSMASQTTAAH